MLNNFRIRVKAYINYRLIKYLQKQKTLVYEGTLLVTMVDGKNHTIHNFKSFQRPELGKFCEFYDCDKRCWHFGTVQACSIKLITEMERYQCNITDVTKKKTLSPLQGLFFLSRLIFAIFTSRFMGRKCFILIHFILFFLKGL